MQTSTLCLCQGKSWGLDFLDAAPGDRRNQFRKMGGALHLSRLTSANLHRVAGRESFLLTYLQPSRPSRRYVRTPSADADLAPGHLSWICKALYESLVQADNYHRLQYLGLLQPWHPLLVNLGYLRPVHNFNAYTQDVTITVHSCHAERQDLI